MKNRITISEFKKTKFVLWERNWLLANEDCEFAYVELIDEENDLFIAFTINLTKGKRRQYNIVFKNFIMTSDNHMDLNNWEGFCYQLFDNVFDIKS